MQYISIVNDLIIIFQARVIILITKIQLLSISEGIKELTGFI